MTIDNFDLIREKILEFKHPGDFYVVHVIKRAKDLKEAGDYKEGDAKESQRLIKTWYIDSLEYWDKKVETIKDMARENHARAYILPCVRNRLTINRVLAKKVIEMIDDTNCRYDHLIRTAVCGCHKTTKPWWIIDLDVDMANPDKTKEQAMEWLKNEYVPAVTIDLQTAVSETSRFCSEIFVVPTANGFHLVTPPFNRAKHFTYMPSSRIMSDPMTLLYYET